MAVCASGSMSAHVCAATARPAFRAASSVVAMPPHSTTRWIDLWVRMYLENVAMGEDEGAFLNEVLGGLGLPVGGMVGESDDGQTEKGLVGCSEGGGVAGRPPLALVFGRNFRCSAVMWQTMRRAEARTKLMRSMHTNWPLPSSFKTRNSSNG